MAGPAFLATAKVLAPPPDVGAGAPAAGASNSVAGLQMTCQEEDQWCWAAVSQTVEQWKGNTLSQSEIASAHVGPGAVPLACIHPLSTGDSGAVCAGCKGKGCGDPHSLGVVLTERGRLPVNGAVQAPPAFSDVVDAIDGLKPCPVRIDWGGNNGHFICVIGYSVDSSGVQRVQFFDPLTPGSPGLTDEQDMRFATFTSAYPSTGGAVGTPNFFYEVA
jgi:hypothetical protein